jgi:hypothetical protein
MLSHHSFFYCQPLPAEEEKDLKQVLGKILGPGKTVKFEEKVNMRSSIFAHYGTDSLMVFCAMSLSHHALWIRLRICFCIFQWVLFPM